MLQAGCVATTSNASRGIRAKPRQSSAWHSQMNGISDAKPNSRALSAISMFAARLTLRTVSESKPRPRFSPPWNGWPKETAGKQVGPLFRVAQNQANGKSRPRLGQEPTKTPHSGAFGEGE